MLPNFVADINVISRYDPIQKFGPSDCIASINAIVDKFDSLVATKNKKAIQEFKAIFGLEALSDIRDFAATIAFPSAYLDPIACQPDSNKFKSEVHSSIQPTPGRNSIGTQDILQTISSISAPM